MRNNSNKYFDEPVDITNNVQNMEQIQNIDLNSLTDTSKSTSIEDTFIRVIQHSQLYFFETKGKIDRINKSKEISNNINNTKNRNPNPAETNYISNLHKDSFHNNMITEPVLKVITHSPIFLLLPITTLPINSKLPTKINY